MINYSVLVLAAFCLVATARPEGKGGESNCGENSKVLDRGICVGTNRQNCENYTHGLMAPKMICAVDGIVCLCKEGEGFSRDENGKCISKEECLQKLGEKYCLKENEVYTECHANCQINCEQLRSDNYVVSCVCNPGCMCKSGFIRDSDGNCISREECLALQDEIIWEDFSSSSANRD